MWALVGRGEGVGDSVVRVAALDTVCPGDAPREGLFCSAACSSSDWTCTVRLAARGLTDGEGDFAGAIDWFSLLGDGAGQV